MSVARHTAYNLVGSVVPIVVTLVTVPLYLKAIGLERYGVLALVWVLAGYFAFFDFGIGRATARKMATLANASPGARNRLFWTSAMLTGALAALAALVFWPVANLFVDRMDIPAILRPELDEALPLLVAAVPVGIVQSLFGGALDGRRAFGTANTIAVVGNILTAILPLASAWLFGPRLALLIAATLLARSLVLIAQAVACRRLVPLRKPKRDGRADISDLVKFGGWVTVTGVVGPFLAYFDRFAIGAWLGAAAVGYYVIGYNLITQLQLIPSSLARALFPRLAELDHDDAKARTEDGLLLIAAIAAPMAIFAMGTVGPFLTIWLGSSIAEVAAPPAAVLLVGFWVNAIAQVPFTALHSRSRPDLTAKVHLAELIPYGVVLAASLSLWGLVGVAFAWSARCAVDCLLLAYLAGMPRKLLPCILLQGGLVGAALASVMLVDSQVTASGLAMAVCVLSLLISWRSLPATLRSRIVDFRRHRLFL